MKKLLFAFVTLFSLSSLLGCSSSSKERLTFGTLYHEEAIEIDNDTCYSKKDTENFILATYGDTTCGCWVYFSRVLDHLAKYDHVLTYKMSNDQIDDRLNEFGIKNSNDPAFYIIANKKLVRRAFYTDNSTLFTDENVLLDTIKETINLPYIYLINEEQIKTEVVDKGGIIYYMRSSCPDCTYCMPNVVMPHLKNWVSDNCVYAFDMDPIRKNEPDRYQTFKDDHYLSNKYNATYGYGDGVVPTFQVYKDGELIDAAVYGNDVITDRKITTSFYDDERSNHLHYISNLIRKSLSDVTLSDYELNSDGQWKDREAQKQYYEPFIEAFFDYYFI
ncbi:MAG: hypothetical protein J5880_00850 [Bacilli bacterium]|nr:hypothetical protein [Bacilli bacterium]